MGVGCACVCLFWRQILCFCLFVWEKFNCIKSLMSFMSREFGALQRSCCLDSGSAIMGFSQITVITLVAVIQGGFLGRQKALVSFSDVQGWIPQWLRLLHTRRILIFLKQKKKGNPSLKTKACYTQMHQVLKSLKNKGCLFLPRI